MVVKKINSKKINDAETSEEPTKGEQSDATTNQTHSIGDLAEKLNEIASLNGKLDNMARYFEGSRFEDVLQNYASPWRVFRINFLVGLARGIGLTVGTAIFFAILIYLLSSIVTMPLIGEYIAELLEWIDSYRNF